MGKLSGDSGELRDAFELSRAQDFKDQQAELSGVATGRMARFTDEDTRDARTGKSSRRERAAERLSRLQQLLATNPAYAKLYNDTMDALGKAERAVEQALERARAALTKSKAALEDTLDRAAQLPNGTRVFKDDQGEVWTEHDQRVDETEAESIVWRDDAPGRQEFLDRRESVAGGVTRLEALQGVQIDLGDIRNRSKDGDEPPSVDEIERFKQTIDEAQALADHQATMLEPTPRKLASQPLTDFNIPEL